MGLTRYITAFYDELALTLKLRLITPDRPGVGDSEPYSDGTATPLSWPGKLMFVNWEVRANCCR
jgi:pimeloyl-ACP methyl ester carboxylesterase